MNKTNSIIAALIVAATTLAVQAAEESPKPVVKPEHKAHYQRPNEPARYRYLRLPAGVVRAHGWIKDWCETARDGVLGRPYNLPIWSDPYLPAAAQRLQVYSKGWTGVDLPGSKHTSARGMQWPAEQCATSLEGAIRLGAILDDRALVDEIKGRLLFVADNLEKADKTAWGFMWWTKNAYPWSPPGTPNKPEGFDVAFGNYNMGHAMVAGYEVTREPRIMRAIERAYGTNYFNGGKCLEIIPQMAEAWAMGASPEMGERLKQGAKSMMNRRKSVTWMTEEMVDKTGNLMLADNKSGRPFMNHAATTLYHKIDVTAMIPWMEEKLAAQILAYVERMFRSYDQYYMMPSGALQGDELMRGIGGYKGVESCSNMQIRWARDLMQVSGNGQYGDSMEKCFFNNLPSCLQRDMKGYTYFDNMNEHPGAPLKSNYLPLQATLCCPGQMAKAMADFVQNMWMGTWDNGLAWVAYGPCALRAKVGEGEGTFVSLKSATAYPFEETIALSVDPEKAVAFPLRLRVPGWCEAFQVKVNGQAVAAKPDGAGFVELRREWKAGDRVEIQLPMKPQVHVAREVEGSPFAAVHYGPLCMTLPTELADKMEKDPKAEWKFVLDAPEGAESRWQVERAAMPKRWDWPLAAPLSLSVTAVRTDWAPVVRKKHDLEEALKHRTDVVDQVHNDQTCLPPQPFPDGETVNIKLIPLGCAHYRLTMFPITARTAPRIVVPNPDPALHAPLFVKESEAAKAKPAAPQTTP